MLIKLTSKGGVSGPHGPSSGSATVDNAHCITNHVNTVHMQFEIERVNYDRL